MAGSGGQFDFDRDFETPDLSEQILGSVDRKRAFLSAPVRRAVSASRLAIGGAVALVALGAAVLYNSHDGFASFRGLDAPLTRVVQDAGAEIQNELSNQEASGFDPLNATFSLTRRALPQYVPGQGQSQHDLAASTASEGLSTIGVPGPCVGSEAMGCVEANRYVVSVSRDLPCDDGRGLCVRVLLVAPGSASDSAEPADAELTDRVIAGRSGAYVP